MKKLKSGQAITNCESFVWNQPASCSVVVNNMGWVATFLPFAQNIIGDVLTEAARVTVPVHSAMSE